jgi:organic radical activating enzyme
MSMKVLEAALAMCRGEFNVIGGGEPTIHPQFERILCRVIAQSEEVWIVTNGKIPERAFLIAKLIAKGAISGRLSLDDWHEPIEPAVIQAFGMNINTVTEPSLAGRCTWGDEARCYCDDFVVKPNGDVFQCGCDDAPFLGNVLTGLELGESGCHRAIL